MAASLHASHAGAASPHRRTLLAAGGFGALGLAATGMAHGWQIPNDLTPKGYLRPSIIEGDSFPYRVIDSTGAVQLVKAPLQRTATLSYAPDEAMIILTGGRAVISPSSLADDASINNAAGLYPKALKRNKGKLEELIGLQPDSVLSHAGLDATLVKTLIAAGITLVRLEFYDSFAGVDVTLRSLARLWAAEAAADRVLGDMWRRLAVIEKAVQGVKRPRVYFASSGYSLTTEMIDRAGGYSIHRDVPHLGNRTLPKEVAIGLQPDVILIGSWRNGEKIRQEALHSRDWAETPAARNRRVYLVDMATTTTGSPYRVRGVEEIARLLHPERFTA